MKILGKTGDGYILSATESEVANIAGFAGHPEMITASDSKTYHRPDGYQFRAGAVFEIGACWERMKMFLAQRGEREATVKRLQKIIESLAIPIPVVDEEEIPKPKGPGALEID